MHYHSIQDLLFRTILKQNWQLNERLNGAVDACLSSLPNGTPECDNLLKIKTEEICKNINKLDVCHDGKVTQYDSIRNETKGMKNKSQLG